jgi:hypothetical protein
VQKLRQKPGPKPKLGQQGVVPKLSNEKKILTYLKTHSPVGKSVEDIRRVGGQHSFTNKQVWEVISRLEHAGKVFRFLIDEKPYMALESDRARAFVMRPLLMADNIRLLYEGFGIYPPLEIKRTAYAILDSDDEDYGYKQMSAH